MKEARRDVKSLRRLAKTLAHEETTLAERVATLKAMPPGQKRDEALATVTKHLDNKRSTIAQTQRQQTHLKTRCRATQRYTPWKRSEDQPREPPQTINNERDDSTSSSDKAPNLPDFSPALDTVPATDTDVAEEPSNDHAAPTEIATSPSEEPVITLPTKAALLFEVSLSPSS